MVGDGTWLTVGEIARMFGVDDNTARKWVDDGLLNEPVKSRRLPTGNRDRRVHRDSAAAFLRRLENPDSEEGASSS